jgi:trans-aconitate methyltransferase
MKQEIIGSYLDRQVDLTEMRDLIDLGNGDFAHSLALIWLCKPDWKSGSLQTLIQALASRGALGITIAGARIDESFDVLLNTLGDLPGPHVMTHLSEKKDEFLVAEDYFYAAYPSEERFDEWHRYSVIVIGDKAVTKGMRNALKSFLEK